jgi:hypothetical protein
VLTEKEQGQKRPIWLTAEQREWLDIQVARKRRVVFEALQPGEEMPFVSRSSFIRDWIDGEIAKEKAA